ncbi:MAG: co-chaperone GroES [Candidatus Eremiobacteraeota bacterium]|nr:co-chaperone GroES [Candidatus Eremiobacteraeota bacterium]
MTAITIKLRPLGDRILVKPLAQEEVTKGGVILPDSAKEKPQKGKVIAAGKGKLTDDGSRVEMEVKPGDLVIYGKYSGTEVKYEGDEYLFIREGDVLAIVG